MPLEVVYLRIRALLLLGCCFLATHMQLHDQRIKGFDEPQLLSTKFLEGITEPYSDGSSNEEAPAWKAMKLFADQKYAAGLLQESLQEYGLILKNPKIFGDIPLSERYQIFLTMSDILKLMGFYEKSELVLYEAISSSKEPYEAHFKISQLQLDKQDLLSAKVHLKNCLYYKEDDLKVLIYISIVLFAEGKHLESAFYMAKIISILDAKVLKLAEILGKQTIINSSPVRNSNLLIDLEDLVTKILFGEFQLIAAATIDMLSFFRQLHESTVQGDMTGRFEFDLGQSLYERGKSEVGKSMMIRGKETCSVAMEGMISCAIVNLRVAFDFPTIPKSFNDILESFAAVSTFLAQNDYSNRINVENIVDCSWSIPTLFFSGLPSAQLVQEFVDSNFFDTSRDGTSSKQWLVGGYDPSVCYDESSSSLRKIKSPLNLNISTESDDSPKIHLGIIGGHFNSHLVGHFLFLRFIRAFVGKDVHVTLIALPIIKDKLTSIIAKYCNAVVNLSVNTKIALKEIERLQLDVVIFPDWQPFPDVQSYFLRTKRLAPIQICLFIRGSSCSSAEIDYYLLPSDVQHFYLNSKYFWLNTTNNEAKWMEPFSEQVTIVDWPIITPQSIFEVVQIAKLLDESRHSKLDSASIAFEPSSLEGQIFFQDQPAAILPFHPSLVHPLMDEAIYAILRNVPKLQILIVIPDVYSHILPTSSGEDATFGDSNEVKAQSLSLEWGKQLVRRLWSKAGILQNRIRLLPNPVSDWRLFQLIKNCDLVLDTFPISLPLHVINMALGAGTAVVTFESGVFPFSHKEMEFSPQYLHQKKNVLSRYFLHFGDYPWSPTISPLAAFYHKTNLSWLLMASNVSQYVNIATTIASDKEFAYNIRVRILEMVENYESSSDAQEDITKNALNEPDLLRLIRNVAQSWSNVRRHRMTNNCYGKR